MAEGQMGSVAKRRRCSDTFLAPSALDHVPPDFICNITHEIMNDPVSTVDGETYERQAIEAWFNTGHITSPLTNVPLSGRQVTPNQTLKRAIANFLASRPHLQAWEEQVSSLEETIAKRENELLEMSSKFSCVVPRVEYERVLLEKRRMQNQLEASLAELEQHRLAGLASRLANEPSPNASGSTHAQEMKPYELLARNRVEKVVHMLTDALALRTRALEDQKSLQDMLETCSDQCAKCEAETSAQEELVVTVRRQIPGMERALLAKAADRDCTGESYRAMATELGIEDVERRLQELREDPTRPTNGPLLTKYAALQEDYAKLEHKRLMTLRTISSCEETASSRRSQLGGLKIKREAIEAQLQLVDGLKQQAGIQKQVVEFLLSCLKSEEEQAVSNAHDINVSLLAQIRGLGVPASSLHDRGFSVMHLRLGGFSAAELIFAPASDLISAGFSVAELKQASLSIARLKDAGVSVAQLKHAGCSAPELKAEGFSAANLKEASFSAAELKDVGFAAMSLKEAGFSLESLKGAGFTAANLKEASFSAAELKDAGCAAMSLKEAGFSVVELAPLCLRKTDAWRVGMDLIAEGKFGKVSHVHNRGHSFIKIRYDDGTSNGQRDEDGDFSPYMYEALLLHFP